MPLIGQRVGERGHAYLTNDHPLVRKLENYAPLGEAEKLAIVEATSHPRRLSAREELVEEGAPPEGMAILLSGFACRTKLLPDGRRQVLAYLVPGDYCDMHVDLLRRMDHTISAATPATVAIISNDAVQSLVRQHAGIGEALRFGRLVEEAIAREWLVNLGQRTAFERTAALLSEIYIRLASAGLARGGECDFPFTQSELAETLGLSAVHINRTLQELRRQGLITLAERRLSIRDLAGLGRAAMYDPGYLHLDQKRRRIF